MKTISICIPTYNRADCIGQNLDSIVEQFSDPEVLASTEVIISDNASTDGTEAVVKKYTNKYSNIFYYRNPQNIGFDRNLMNVVEKATGEFCMTIGDDDAFFPDSLAVMLKEIRKAPECPYFMVNYKGYDHELKNPVGAETGLPISSDMKYKTLSDFVHSIKEYHQTVGFFGGMSTQLFKRSAWMAFPDKEKYVGTQCVHFYIILSSFKDSPFTQLAMPMVKTRNDNIRWDTYPGYETNAKRIRMTVNGMLWIKNLYSLPMPAWKIKLYFWRRGYWSTFKTFVKVTLHKLGLRK